MIRLGYLDEDKGNRNTFYRVFKKDFEVIMLDDNTRFTSADKVLDEIDRFELDVLAVDFRLAEGGLVAFNGDEVVRAIWNRRRYFPVFMLTSYVNNALEKMDNVFLVNDKDSLSNNDSISLLKKQISSSVETYHRIVREKEEQLKILVEKQKAGELTDKEEKDLLALNVEMNNIDPESNPMSPDMMQTKSITDLHEMVDMTRTLLKSIKGGE